MDDKNTKQQQKKKPSAPFVVAVTAVALAVSFGLVMVAANAWSSYVDAEKEKAVEQYNATHKSDKSTVEQFTTLYTTQQTDGKVFKFGEGAFDSNTSYARYVGTVTNVSDSTRYFVKVRGTFSDDAGNAIDTDWTYACGDEGLKPGESTKFTLSVPQDQRITRVHYEIYDYR